MRAPEDLTAFCERQWPILVGALSLYCGERQVAEELAQDALEKVCLHWDDVRAMAAPGAWTYRVAINLANSRFRRLLAGRRATRRLADESSRDLAEAVSDGVTLREAVARLPARQREAVVLRFFADLTPDEVGEAMGCSGQAVRNLTHRAVASLRGELRDEYLQQEVMSDVD